MKVRKIAWAILIFFVIVMLGGTITNLVRPLLPKKEETPPSPDPIVTYSIEYVAIQSGKTAEIYEDFWLENGSYPTTYIAGEGAIVSDLKAIVYPSSTEDREFKGWYWDAACTQEFDGTIGENVAGDLTIYAKISVGMWTKNY